MTRMLIVTSDKFSTGLVPGHHQLRHPGQRGPQRDVLSRLTCPAATSDKVYLAFCEFRSRVTVIFSYFVINE